MSCKCFLSSAQPPSPLFFSRHIGVAALRLDLHLAANAPGFVLSCLVPVVLLPSSPPIFHLFLLPAPDHLASSRMSNIMFIYAHHLCSLSTAKRAASVAPFRRAGFQVKAALAAPPTEFLLMMQVLVVFRFAPFHACQARGYCRRRLDHCSIDTTMM